MFKLTYKQLVVLPFVLGKYKNSRRLREQFLIWTLPSVMRDSVVLIFVVSFCFVKHRSSHFLVLYVIISFSIYYFWLRFLQLKYSEPLPSKLQAKYDLVFDIRHLYRLVALSPYLTGFFAVICILGIYLLYAGKSILLTAALASETVAHETLEGPVEQAAAEFLGMKMAAFRRLLDLKGFRPWLESAKNSSAGFFPISMTSLLHLQCFTDLHIWKPAEQALIEQGKSQLPGLRLLPEPTSLSTISGSNLQAPNGVSNSLSVQLWSLFYQVFLSKQILGKPTKYITYAYMFKNMGSGPFFGHFRNDLELVKLLENLSSETFSLFQFLRFAFETAFRLWIPIFSLGYKSWLAWWIHPYCDISLINLIGQSRYIFEPFMIGVSLVLDDSIQQIFASFYMDRWFFPAYHFLNGWNPLRPANMLESCAAYFNSSDGKLGFQPNKLSKFILTVAGYNLKYASIYVPCEQTRIRVTLQIFKVLLSPIIIPVVIGFHILVFSFKVFVWLTYDSFIHFIPEVIFNPF